MKKAQSIKQKKRNQISIDQKMLGSDKNRVSIKQTTKIKETIPASQVRQQISHGTSLLGGPYTTQYSNAQQFPTQQYPMQQSTTQPLNPQLLTSQPISTQQGYTGYTTDPYLSNIPMEQQLINNGSKVETTIKTKTKIKQKTKTSNVNQGLEPMIPVQSSNLAYGTSMPTGTNVMQRKRSSSSSSSGSDRDKMRNTVGVINTSNVETLGQTQPYPQNTYTTQLPFQSGNIQTGYGTTQVGYQNPSLNPVNPIESTLYRSSTQRKGPILGKNLYGQTGFASTGYSIQQPFPGQNVYIEEDPTKISETTKSKFERSIM